LRAGLPFLSARRFFSAAGPAGIYDPTKKARRAGCSFWNGNANLGECCATGIGMRPVRAQENI